MPSFAFDVYLGAFPTAGARGVGRHFPTDGTWRISSAAWTGLRRGRERLATLPSALTLAGFVREAR